MFFSLFFFFGITLNPLKSVGCLWNTWECSHAGLELQDRPAHVLFTSQLSLLASSTVVHVQHWQTINVSLIFSTRKRCFVRLYRTSALQHTCTHFFFFYYNLPVKLKPCRLVSCVVNDAVQSEWVFSCSHHCLFMPCTLSKHIGNKRHEEMPCGGLWHAHCWEICLYTNHIAVHIAGWCCTPTLQSVSLNLFLIFFQRELEIHRVYLNCPVASFGISGILGGWGRSQWWIIPPVRLYIYIYLRQW